MVSGDPARSQLVLRAFQLNADAPADALSARWHDFAVEGIRGSRYLVLPGPALRVRAVLGLRDQPGRFSPLLRSEAVSLPAPPPPPPQAPAAEAPARAAPAPAPAAMDENEVTARINALRRLPDGLKTIGKSPVGNKLAGETVLDEASVLASVHRSLASDPEPTIPPQPVPSAAAVFRTAGASEQLASQWEELWSAGAPLEVRAELILTGRLAPGMRLLLGHDEVTCAPGGFIHWSRRLEDFGQAWPLLQAGLTTPVVSAEPALRFFPAAGEAEPLLELQASLQVEGRVTDPAYVGRLPADLHPDGNGVFKLSRALPHGAVILPGLSLIAAS